MTVADWFVHTRFARNKHPAVAAGRNEAIRRKSDHVIHNEDGSIGEHKSYDGDPAHRPG
jgi:uncharacterized protein DUF2188